MATIAITPVANTPTDGMNIVQWFGLAGDDVGEPMAWGSYADKTVQVYGTVDPSGGITIQGSNDPLVETDPDNAVWSTLSDNLGNELVFTEAGLKLIAEAPRYIRPNAGTGTTDANVIIVANKS